MANPRATAAAAATACTTAGHAPSAIGSVSHDDGVASRMGSTPWSCARWRVAPAARSVPSITARTASPSAPKANQSEPTRAGSSAPTRSTT